MGRNTNSDRPEALLVLGKDDPALWQITTHSGSSHTSAQDRNLDTEVVLRIDIQQNKPILSRTKNRTNKPHWQGTIIEFKTEAGLFASNAQDSRILQTDRPS